jgi:hypothetical protein
VVGQAFIIDENDIWKGIEGPLPPRNGGILENFVDLVATEWLVLCPAIVVKRVAYEMVGGYSNFFKGANDWEMWMRLGLHSPVACVARPHSLYRRQANSLSKLLTSTGDNVLEEWYAVATNLARIHVAARPRPVDTTSWRARHAKWADQNVRQLNGRNNVGRYNQARWALVLDPTARRLLTFVAIWAKQRLSPITISGTSSHDRAPLGRAQSILSRFNSSLRRVFMGTRVVDQRPLSSDVTEARKI